MAAPNYGSLVQGMRDAFNTGRTKDLKWRKQQLRAVIRMMEERQDEFCEAVRKDLHKNKAETLPLEVMMVRNDAVMCLNNLDKWAAPEPAEKNLLSMFDGVEIRSEPYGVALVIGAWNYPVQLALVPLVGAIAAGNCAILKPSEVSEATAKALGEIIPQYLDQDCIKVINGAVPETTALLTERFDYIFYTGNSVVAKIVYQAAAKYLTPVTLELGGKSPCYVANDSDITLAGRRIAWGKWLNAGQTCIAPDYILCQPDIQEKLVEGLRKAVKEFYGEKPVESEDYGSIVNKRHLARVKEYLSSGRIVFGGACDEDKNILEPTILVDCKPTDPAMQSEIFGPVLPIMTVKDEDEAISFIKTKEKSLAMYIFTKNMKVVEKIIGSTSTGGVTVNDTMMHVSSPSLPFGGVGESGVGAYHGKFSFDTFSHKRSCFLRKQNMEMVNNARYPPYTKSKMRILDFALKRPITEGRSGIMSYFPFVLIGIILAYLFKAKM